MNEWGRGLRRVAAGLTLLSACVGPGTLDGAVDGPAVTVNVAALNLTGVGDVVWDVEVVNGRLPTPDVVWQRRLSSSGYGDGAGSASYVGPCDADPTVRENEVRVWVVGVYSGPVSNLGTFAAGGAGGVAGAAVPFQNPTTPVAPLTQKIACEQNADAAVRFDVALMRPAQQGFFDIAVSFDNIFCSAKFDCCTGTACAQDITMLFQPGGARGPTMVLGFACTAGAQTDVETELYLDELQLDCTTPSAGFAADFTIDPSRAPGNQCAAGAVGGGDCPAVAAPTGLDADTYLYQVGVYRGFEALTSDGVDAQKAYWNVALGVKRPAIASCWLRTRGTADDAAGTSVVDNGTIAAGAVYPYVQWDVRLGTCQAEQLTFGGGAAMVRPEYSEMNGPATAFAFGFGPGRPAGSFCTPECVNGACVSGACSCALGFSGATCATNDDDCGVGACGAPTAGTCSDGVASYSCACNPGYYDDGATCAACPAMAHCASGLTCTGPDPADATCGACDAGYATPDCSDVDECLANSALCGAASGWGTCANSDGSFSCSCNAGYYGSGTTSCAACDAVAYCTAVTCTGAGASTCTACASGYVISGASCVPEVVPVTFPAWYRMPSTLGGTLSNGVATNTVWNSEANPVRFYESVVLARNETGDFDAIASWGHDYPGFGIVHGPAVSYAHVNGYSVDPYGPYWGALATTGFPSGYGGTFKGKYLNTEKGTNTATWWFRWTRTGGTVWIRYSSSGVNGPWTNVPGSPFAVPATDVVVIGIGEAYSTEGTPLRLLSYSENGVAAQ